MDELVTKFNLIIQKIKSGNIQALDELYQDYGGLLYSMAKKYLIDKSFAEDVVSEVFCKIVKSSKHFNPKYNGLNWAFKIVKNTCIDWNRTFSTNHEDVKEYNSLIPVISNFDELDNHNDLLKALALLNNEENLILYYKYWEGLTIREIAIKLKKPKSNIQYIYQQSLKKLAVYLNESEENK